ncbi:cytochrome P450 [Bradyrhizobium sp. KB893862 SZCCT0404]|uniref:cytochrome P450 n=1 Tax=Bradyrhizobium sp. KB893862 SZCCT0404 TaxID=2807672 RepID=UPI001BAE14D7|nr:cytochrome P450 [Bradyrhizobium sp. KB893862 SZCCT0404]MBR1175287.1 cytochrome P450 [Bradyrhizobium sp. KB893862 SZCCT0404]
MLTAQLQAELSSEQGVKCPVSRVDPFEREFLTDPYPFHEELRDAGPVVWLERYQVWGMARYAEVYAAMQDWQTYSSAAGVGIDDFRKTKAWRPPSLLLEVDPPLHTRTRAVMSKILSPAAMRRLREDWQKRADTLVDKLVERETFDAVKDLASVFPVWAFPDAIGIGQEGRENLLPFGNMVFNSFGPRNEIFLESIKEAEPVVSWIYAQCARDLLAPGSFGAQVYEALDRGEIQPDEAPVLVRAMLTAGLDTTVIGIGSSIHGFALYPEQWQKLRANPTLIRPSFDELLRWASPVQTFFRTTTRDVQIGETTIPDGSKVLLFLGSANRDPRKWEKPEHFDITRSTTGHVGFGTGIHGCVGQMVARMEAEVVLTAMIKRIKAIEIIGEPVRRLNNTLRSLSSLPVRIIPA